MDNAIVRPRIHSAAKKPLQEIVPLRTPLSAHIDISSVCNYRCSFCFQADAKGMKDVGLKRGFMEYGMFKKIVDDFKAFPQKIKKIKIGNHGEPTLNPEIAEMIAYANQSDTADIVEVFTNGSKLEPVLNEKLVDAGLKRINISLEGLTDQRYKDVAGVKQNFQEIIDGVKSLYEIKNRKNSELKIYVKIADQAHSLNAEDNITFVLSEEEKDYFFKTFGPICDEIFVEKVVPQWAETQLEKQNDVNATGMYGQKIGDWKEVCPFVFMYMHFNCDGTVSPCTLDWPRKVVIGNVNEASVSEIWNGNKLRKLQIAMLAKQRKSIDFCRNCSAPMVCVEENLDSYLEDVIVLMGAQKDVAELDKNPWLMANEVINFSKK
jgi:radical SAM protein with 4Fe4S-binding SPASM domain